MTKPGVLPAAVRFFLDNFESMDPTSKLTILRLLQIALWKYNLLAMFGLRHSRNDDVMFAASGRGKKY